MRALKPLALLGALWWGAGTAFPQDLSTPSPKPQDARKIQKKILKNKKSLGEIERKLAEEKRRQAQDAAREQNLLNRLQAADQDLNRLKREKKANQQDLYETQAQTQVLHDEVGLSRQRLEQSREIMRKRLRDLYRMSFQEPFLNGWLESESSADLARKIKFETLLAQSNGKLLSQTQRQNEDLTRSSDLLDAQERHQKRVLDALARQEKTFARQQKNRNLFLATIRRQQSLREQTIAELNQAAEDLKSKVSNLLAQSAEARKRPSYTPAGEGLEVVRGRVPWPVSGTIVSFFGTQHSREFNATVVNTGIQIRANAGTPFKAVAAGVVRYADWFKGYGKLVILDHGRGYYSLYAQASDLSVTTGQRVEAGQVLGLVGDTGSLLDGSSLYFEIRKDGQPEDPVKWLKRQAAG
ncbi:MAG TPA: peptidoglycan DD-metalloendopeptidase family protein [bacterium]|nr:peptidoglycan DD-metalloendopeptidase family protein [bacterium]